MKRAPGDTIDLVLYAAFWLLLLFGVFAHDWWMFAPAAFFILLDHIGPRK